MRSALSAVWGRHGRTGHSSREPRRASLLALSATGGAPPTASIPDCGELMAGSPLSLVAQRHGWPPDRRPPAAVGVQTRVRFVLGGQAAAVLRRRVVSTMSTTSATVSVRAQSL